MNSKELIGDCRKRFDELQEETESFEKMIKDLVVRSIEDYLIVIQLGSKDVNLPHIKLFIRKLIEEVEYLLQTTKSLHWKSFYNGWLEGRIDLTKDNNLSKNEKD